MGIEKKSWRLIGILIQWWYFGKRVLKIWRFQCYEYWAKFWTVVNAEAGEMHAIEFLKLSIYKT